VKRRRLVPRCSKLCARHARRRGKGELVTHSGSVRRFDTVVGVGQGGLAVGYYLAKQRTDFAILDARDSVGDTWRGRWDSLRLFTPSRYDGPPGMPVHAERNRRNGGRFSGGSSISRRPVRLGCVGRKRLRGRLHEEGGRVGVRSRTVAEEAALHLGRFMEFFGDVYGHDRPSTVVRRDVQGWQRSLVEQELAALLCMMRLHNTHAPPGIRTKTSSGHPLPARVGPE
jgi:hypothetical protein